MKKILIYALLSVFFLTTCSPPGGQSKLEKLEAKRDALNEQIKKLKMEMGQETAPPVNNEKIPHVNIDQVKKGLFDHFIKVQGTVESDNNILIPHQVSGIIKKIHVKAGNWVKRGQLLAEIDGAILESSLAELKNGLALATTIYERQQRLWDKKIGSEVQYLQAKNNKESLEKKLETLNEQYKMTKITSPINGTVDEVLIKEGEMAAAGFGAFRVVQLSSLKIKADLSEIYISRVRKGDMVQVQIPILDLNLDLAVSAVSQVIDPDNRTFHIEIRIPRNTKDIKPNMLAVLNINDYSNPEALSVPEKIIQKNGGEQFLYVAVEEDSWIVRKRIIETGKIYLDSIEILSGLSEGEYVVTFGYQNLTDGQKIFIDEGPSDQ
jgi:RND family efflux transporter MFP subunit